MNNTNLCNGKRNNRVNHWVNRFVAFYRRLYICKIQFFFAPTLRIREEQAGEINTQRHTKQDALFARRILGNLPTRDLDQFEKKCPVYKPEERARPQGNQLTTIECSVVLNQARVQARQQTRQLPTLNGDL
jgi:hypothetical protein